MWLVKIFFFLIFTEDVYTTLLKENSWHKRPPSSSQFWNWCPCNHIVRSQFSVKTETLFSSASSGLSIQQALHTCLIQRISIILRKDKSSASIWNSFLFLKYFPNFLIPSVIGVTIFLCKWPIVLWIPRTCHSQLAIALVERLLLLTSPHQQHSFPESTTELFSFRKMIKLPSSHSEYPVFQWASMVGLSNAVDLALTEAGMTI